MMQKLSTATEKQFSDMCNNFVQDPNPLGLLRLKAAIGTGRNIFGFNISYLKVMKCLAQSSCANPRDIVPETINGETTCSVEFHRMCYLGALMRHCKATDKTQELIEVLEALKNNKEADFKTRFLFLYNGCEKTLLPLINLHINLVVDQPDIIEKIIDKLEYDPSVTNALFNQITSLNLKIAELRSKNISQDDEQYKNVLRDRDRHLNLILAWLNKHYPESDIQQHNVAIYQAVAAIQRIDPMNKKGTTSAVVEIVNYERTNHYYDADMKIIQVFEELKCIKDKKVREIFKRICQFLHERKVEDAPSLVASLITTLDYDASIETETLVMQIIDRIIRQNVLLNNNLLSLINWAIKTKCYHIAIKFLNMANIEQLMLNRPEEYLNVLSVIASNDQYFIQALPFINAINEVPIMPKDTPEAYRKVSLLTQIEHINIEKTEDKEKLFALVNTILNKLADHKSKDKIVKQAIPITQKQKN